MTTWAVTVNRPGKGFPEHSVKKMSGMLFRSAKPCLTAAVLPYARCRLGQKVLSFPDPGRAPLSTAAGQLGSAERMRPRRAFLYMPGSSMKMLEKAITLQVDSAVLDIEDGVAANKKHEVSCAKVMALLVRGIRSPALCSRRVPTSTIC